MPKPRPSFTAMTSVFLYHHPLYESTCTPFNYGRVEEPADIDRTSFCADELAGKVTTIEDFGCVQVPSAVSEISC
jgi:hypothetical protein